MIIFADTSKLEKDSLVVKLKTDKLNSISQAKTMKTSQLIEKLQKAMAQYGDIDVCFRDTTKGARSINNVSPAYPWEAGLTLDNLEADSVFLMLDK